MIDKTERGFKIFKDEDIYGHRFSLQKSSLASRDAIWLGVDDPEPKIMESQAKKYGIQTTETTGEIPYPVPSEVLISTRMHLDRKKVAEIIPYLQYFVEHGDLPDEELQPMEYIKEKNENI